jgi:autotransporter-associated beta strand protein
MQKTTPSRTHHFAVCFLAASAILAASTALAANVIWRATPPTNAFSNASNWSGGTPAGNTIIFSGPSTITTVVNDINNLTVTGITIGSSAQTTTPYTINGPQPITLTPALDALEWASGNFTLGGQGTQTINAPLVFGTGNHIVQLPNLLSPTPPATLNLSGNVSRQAGSLTLVTRNTGIINTTGSGLTNTNGILGGWALVAEGTAPAAWATLNANNQIVPFTNYIPSNSAIDLSDPQFALGNISVNQLVNALNPGTIDVNSLSAGRNGATIKMSTNTNLRLGKIGGVYAYLGPLNIGTPGNIGTLTAGGAPDTSGELVFFGDTRLFAGADRIMVLATIADNGSGPVSVTAAGGVRLAGNNTYTGGTTITHGLIYAEHANAFGTGNVNILSGAQLRLADPGTFHNNFTIAGKGTSATNLRGVFQFQAEATIAGTVTLASTATMSGPGSISGKITGPGALSLDGSGVPWTQITLGNGPGSPMNDYRGDTTVYFGVITFAPGSHNVMPHGPGFGNLRLLDSIGSHLYLNGTTQTLNGFYGAWGNHVAGPTGSHLIVGDNNASSEFTGGIASDVKVTKIGNGTFTLSGQNTFTGPIVIEQGTLLIKRDDAIPNHGTVILGADTRSGTLDLGGFHPTVSSLSISGTGANNIIGNSSTVSLSTITFENGTSTYAGKIVHTLGAGNKGTGLTIRGGTLTLTGGESTYGGTTTMYAGTLLLNNTAGSATGFSSILINGGTLGGHGAMTQGVFAGFAAHTIAPSATLPTNSVGTLTLGRLTTKSFTTLAFNLNEPNSSNNDKLNVTNSNALTLNGGIIAINFPNTTAALGDYHIIQYNGAIQGAGLASLTLPPTVNNISYFLRTNHTPNHITLHVGILGDANDDGTVNFSDFIVLTQNFGQPGSWSNANFDNSSLTDFNDFITLSQNFGKSVGAAGLIISDEELAQFQSASQSFFAGTGIPEPTSLAILALAATASLLHRKRRD